LQIDDGARLAVQVLGPIEVHWDRRLVDIGGAKPKALIALLAIDRNLTVAADRLTDALWPGHDSECADIDLRSAVSRLRKRLRTAGADHPLIVTRSAGYALELEPDQLDAAQFEQWVAEAREDHGTGHFEEAAGRLRMALALWRGRPFGEAADEPFARTEARRLEELRLAAIELRVDAELALGRHGELVAELEALSDEHPEREELWGRRMLALYRCGRQAEALRVYQTLRHNLIEQLGIEPGPDVTRLEQQILTQHPELAWHDARQSGPPVAPLVGESGTGAEPVPPLDREVVDVPTVDGPVADGGHGTVVAPSGEVLDEVADVFPLVGRQTELATLGRWWAAVTTGNGVPLLAISGEMGVGKTRLARALAKQAAADGALVLWSRCDEEPIEPYQPFAELLRHYVAGLSPAELDRIPLWQTAELSHLVPGLRGRVEERLRSKGGRGDADVERLRFVQAITSTLTELSKGRHVLLVLDDLHHADHPTLLLLRHLLRSRHGSGPVVLTTYRPTDMPPGHPLRAALSRMNGDVEPMQLAIGGLDEAAVEELLAAAGVGEGSDAPGLLYLTRGNPLMLCEIIAQLTGGGPDAGTPASAGGLLELPVPATISELLAGRLAGLPHDVITLVEAAAVAGPLFDAHVTGEAAGLDPSQALDAFDRAVAVGLLREEVGAEGHYAFAHPLLREAIYRSMSRGRRVRLHHRTAEAISTLGPTLRDRHLDDLARHAALGVALGDPVEVVRSCLVAGRHALRQRSRQAVGHFVRALGILDRYGGEPVTRCDVLLGLAEARLASGEQRPASEAASEAAQIARRLEDTGRLARAVQCGAQEGLAVTATSTGPNGVPPPAGIPGTPPPAPAVRAPTSAGD